jgi:glycine/D-amino acid oxidase-like deaminating enzyme/nitrite reductase/ring-hydroxylating ferredoxin subunit
MNSPSSDKSSIHELPGSNRSLWTALAQQERRYPKLQGQVTVDVAIIGAGIAGLTTAHELKKAGKRVAVIEARQVGHQVTGRSNAKITSLHSLIYADLTDRLGEEKARLYGEANQEAINYIARTVTDLRIDCALERRPAYTVTCDPNRIGEIEAEVEAAQRLGLPAAMVRQLDLPYAIQAAVRFDHQGQFNPTAYLTALAGVVDGDGSFVFEGTRVLDVEDGEPARATCQGGEVTARDIVVATNLPIIPQGEFHKKAKPRAHLVMAAPIPADKDLGGMYLNIDAPTHSLRTTPADGGRMLIAVGESYSPGKVQDTASMYLALAGFIRERFEIEPVAYRWANEDYDSQDRLPFVGLASREVKHLHVATGFCSWGITNGTAAGHILSDTLIGRRNDRAELFDATREPGKAPNSGSPPKKSEDAAKPQHPDDLKAGEGAVFKKNGQPVAVHRDADGRLHAVSAKCTHLGCEVAWNNGEATWDCTCHGSIFAADGTVLHGPAVSDLERQEV